MLIIIAFIRNNYMQISLYLLIAIDLVFLTVNKMKFIVSQTGIKTTFQKYATKS